MSRRSVSRALGRNFELLLQDGTPEPSEHVAGRLHGPGPFYPSRLSPAPLSGAASLGDVHRAYRNRSSEARISDRPSTSSKVRSLLKAFRQPPPEAS